jgi:hypothetical protein
MMTKISGKTLFVLASLAFVALSRLMPHIPNFTPIAAMALFGGAFLSTKQQAFLFTFAALMLSDLLVNTFLYNDTNFMAYFAEPFVWAVYFSFAITVIMGIALRNKVTVKKVGFLSVSSSLIFWLITNFACWPNNPLYTQDFSGLINCYIAAIPFLGNIVGDLFYNTLLFGTFLLASQKIPALVRS